MSELLQLELDDSCTFAAPGYAAKSSIERTSGGAPASVFEQPTTVAEFLNEADGTCGSWADFLVATAAAQGVVGATAVGIVARVPNPPKPAQPEYTILAYQSLLVYRTLMGQGGKPVADKFLDHAVVEFGGRVYDPSYGRDYDTEVAWEDAAIEGYKFNWAKRVGADADLIPTYSDDVKGLQETAWE